MIQNSFQVCLPLLLNHLESFSPLGVNIAQVGLAVAMGTAHEDTAQLEVVMLSGQNLSHGVGTLEAKNAESMRNPRSQ